MEKATLVFQDQEDNMGMGQMVYAMLQDGNRVYFNRIVHKTSREVEYLGQETFELKTGTWEET